MAKHNNTFLCPGCGANYKLVHTMGTGRMEGDLHCLVCDHPFEAMKDGQILKYFLVRRPSQEKRLKAIAT